MDKPTQKQIEIALSGQVGEKIEQLESLMMQHEQVEVDAKHRFVNGMYAREILIPKDTLLTGRVHKKDYIDIMIYGDITVATKNGTKRLTGYNVLDGNAGRKRAGYAHEDTLWITVHRTDHVNPDDILDQLTFFSLGEYKRYRIESDKNDYKALVESLPFTEQEIKEQVEADDLIEMPDHYSKEVYVADSDIDGKGLFANNAFVRGDHIAPARVSGNRTICGRYSNHSARPNAIMLLLDNGDVALAALREIAKGEEITTDYRNKLSAFQEVI